ncbi:VOC family protein, partial [Xanthomonas citri]
MSPAIDRLPAQESDARERRIDYVEFASIDPDASRAFFEAVFGWQFQAYGPDYLAFNDGRLDGGFYRAAAPAPDEGGPLVVLYADALAPVIERVRGAGG